MHIRQVTRSIIVKLAELYKGYNEFDGEFMCVEVTLTMSAGKIDDPTDISVLDSIVGEIWEDWSDSVSENVPDFNDTNRLKFISDIKNHVNSRLSGMTLTKIDIDAWVQHGDEVIVDE